MSVCKPWLWPSAPSSRRPLDHIWARPKLELQWRVGSAGVGGVRVRHSVPSDSSPARHSWHQSVIHARRSCHEGNRRVNEAVEPFWSTERMLDVFGFDASAPVRAWMLNDEAFEGAEIVGRRRGHQSSLANRPFSPKSALFRRR